MDLRSLAAVLVVCGLAAPVLAAPAPVDGRIRARTTRNPQRARFVYQDVERFISVLPHLEGAPDGVHVLRTRYFARGTPGLHIFAEKYGLTPPSLRKAIDDHPEAYRTLRDTLAALRAQEPSFRAAYARLRTIIQHAEFAPTYFLVGDYNNIASGSIRGALVTVERRTPRSIAGGLATTLVHEMVHMQQLRALGERYFTVYGRQKNLLALTIREGIAVFFAERAVGLERHRRPARDYLLAQESDIWCRFRETMMSDQTGDWMWRKPIDPGQPTDLGYVLGARIVEAYYERATDKAAAVKRILAVTDYPAFLAASGYAERQDAKCVMP